MSEEVDQETVKLNTPNEKQWYIVHVYSGMEKSVSRTLKERIDRLGLSDKFGQILVPVEKITETKNKKEKISERLFYPGYIFVEMEMSHDTWHLVKDTNKVTGFPGTTPSNPIPNPMSKEEVEELQLKMQEGTERPRPKETYEKGELLRIKDGPFTDFDGEVQEINYEKSKLRVTVTIFGRSTPVELDFGQVEKK